MSNNTNSHTQKSKVFVAFVALFVFVAVAVVSVVAPHMALANSVDSQMQTVTVSPQKLSIYYQQDDPRWTDNVIGGHAFGKTGSVPTAIAMVTSGLGLDYTPIVWGDVLNLASVFNGKEKVGANSDAIVKAADLQTMSHTAVKDVAQLKEELQAGHDIIGLFSKPASSEDESTNYAIVMSGIDSDSKTTVKDTFGGRNKVSGVYSVQDLWDTRSTDSSDTATAGSSFISIYNSPEIIDGKVVTISNVTDSSKVLDVARGSTDSGANIQIWSTNGTDAQKFKLEKNQDDTYTIRNIHSNKVIDISGGNLISGANVQQYDANGTCAQKWMIDQVDNHYQIISACNNELSLDIASDVLSDGVNVQISKVNNSSTQKFVILPVK